VWGGKFHSKPELFTFLITRRTKPKDIIHRDIRAYMIVEISASYSYNTNYLKGSTTLANRKRGFNIFRERLNEVGMGTAVPWRWSQL
jgi:hypothetical protein